MPKKASGPFKSAKNGQFVSAKKAASSPSTTYKLGSKKKRGK